MTTPMGNQYRHNTSLNFSSRYIANFMPTLSICKSVVNCSPNLLLLKVARYEKPYFGPFSLPCVLTLPCTVAYSYCTMPTPVAHHALPCLLTTPCSAFALPDFALSPCPVLPFPAFPYPVLSCPACKLSNFRPKRP